MFLWNFIWFPYCFVIKVSLDAGKLLWNLLNSSQDDAVNVLTSGCQSKQLVDYLGQYASWSQMLFLFCCFFLFVGEDFPLLHPTCFL